MWNFNASGRGGGCKRDTFIKTAPPLSAGQPRVLARHHAPLEVRPVKGDERAKGSHLAPLPTLHLDMPAAVAAAFLESTKAEADAKHRRKLACRAARQEAAQSRPAEWRAGPQPTGPVRPTVALDSPRDLQPLGLDGKFVSSGAIRQRLQEMEDASFSNPYGRQAAGMRRDAWTSTERAQARDWLTGARQINRQIASDNEDAHDWVHFDCTLELELSSPIASNVQLLASKELAELVNSAKDLLPRSSSVPAGGARHAAKVLREERHAFARRIAKSAARNRKPYDPLFSPNVLLEAGNSISAGDAARTAVQEMCSSTRSEAGEAVVVAEVEVLEAPKSPAPDLLKVLELPMKGEADTFEPATEVTVQVTTPTESPPSRKEELAEVLHQMVATADANMQADHHFDSIQANCLELNRFNTDSVSARGAIIECLHHVTDVGKQESESEEGEAGTMANHPQVEQAALANTSEDHPPTREAEEAETHGITQDSQACRWRARAEEEVAPEEQSLLDDLEELAKEVGAEDLEQGATEAGAGRRWTSTPPFCLLGNVLRTGTPTGKTAGRPRVENEFRVELAKGSKGLGLTVCPDAQNRELLVVQVDPEGAVAQYNSKELARGSAKLILPRTGSIMKITLTQVNGIRGDVEAMVEAMKESGKLDLRVRPVRTQERQERSWSQDLVSIIGAVRAVKNVSRLQRAQSGVMDPLPDVIHRRDESLQGLVLPCRLLGEALAQDDQFLSLEETSVAGGGSADYDFSLPQFALDAAGTSSLPSTGFTQQGLLPEIQRLWRSFDSKIVLWKYDDPAVQEAVLQLVVDASRGLLFALSSSNITLFQVPPSQQDAYGRLEEKPVVQLCSISQSSIANEVGRIKARLFPGLLPVGSRGLNPFGSGLVSAAPPKLIKVLTVGRPLGGSVIACVVAEDGTRIFLRGNSRPVPQGADGNKQGRSVRANITSMAVHHVRFLDANAPKDLHVKDALWENGVTLLHCSFGTEGSTRDAVVALSTDLRVVAQRQGRGHSPWVNVAGTAEHVDTISLTQETEIPQIFGIASLPAPISKPIERLFSNPSQGLILPVAHLSELAKEQLLAAPRFMVISSIGAHVLRRMQPLDALREHLLAGQLPALQEFVGQYTAEQACALLFQVLTLAVPKLNPEAVDKQMGLSRNKGSKLKSQTRSNAGLLEPRGLGAGAFAGPAGLRDPTEEVLLLRAEQLLLSQQLSFQLGFAQALPSIEAGAHPFQGSPLGYSVMFQSAARLSARMRGLYLYLSRLLRPLWLSQVMLVAWPPVSEKKRRRDEWWPPPPDPPPVAKGAQWQCAFSQSQRAFLRSQLLLLKSALDRCLPRLCREGCLLPVNGGGGSEEVDAANGAMQILVASMEALDFLELMSNCTAAMASGSCSAETLLRFSELTFRDLVCQAEARKVLQQLMQAGIVACRDLSNCPSLFHQADLEVQEAYEILKLVESSLQAATQSTLELARLSHLTHRALETLERNAAQVNLMDAAARLRAVGACKGLIALCSSVARARDPKDEALRPQDPSNPRLQQLHYARLECYQVVLGLLEDVCSFARQRSGSILQSLAPTERRMELPELLPSHLSDADAMAILDGLLRHCLEGHRYQADELFHFCVLKWMMQCGLPPYQYKSPYLKNFLLVHAKDHPELHCRYLQHNGRWAEACDAYLSLARDAERQDGHDDRLLMLQNAALCARMPRSNRRVEPILRMMSETAKQNPGPGKFETRQSII
eukprot:g8706.t1